MLTKVNKNNKNVNKSVDKLVIMIYINIMLIKVNKFKTNVNYVERRKKLLFRNSLKVPNKIWKDKRIKKECKIIYSLIYSKCYNQTIIHLNVGDIQQDIKIKNKALRKHLDNLKVLNYIDVKEYATGLYMIHLLR